VLIVNNVFENCWVDAQSGHAVQFTVRNQDGTAPWSTVRDVTFQYNVIRNAAGFGLNVLGEPLFGHLHRPHANAQSEA
jgi:hypothetical protein